MRVVIYDQDLGYYSHVRNYGVPEAPKRAQRILACRTGVLYGDNLEGMATSMVGLKLSVMNLFRYTGRLHCWLYRVTGGVFTGLASGTPVLLLTTTGRKSGRYYTTPLLFLPDGPDLVVVASYAGRDVDPDWWKNLQANPKARVQVGTHHWRVEANQAGEEDKARLWPVFCRYYPPYQKYQSKTSRVIPLIRLGVEAG